MVSRVLLQRFPWATLSSVGGTGHTGFPGTFQHNLGSGYRIQHIDHQLDSRKYVSTVSLGVSIEIMLLLNIRVRPINAIMMQIKPLFVLFLYRVQGVPKKLK